MGVARITGAREGAPEYFREGNKAGNEFTRDELDERIILFGDLDVTSEIIETVPGTGDRYLHITFSVKERDLSVDIFRQIGQDVKQFVLAAYAPDEMDFYCELQRARIKNIINKSTGEWHERYDHLHILIPLVNLETGKKENPLGLVKDNLRFVDAMQEHINNKYNLSSPKDNERIGVSKADIIDRTKVGGKEFKKGAFKAVKGDLKTQLREKVGTAEVEDYASFQNYLKTQGDLKIRKPGKPDEYLAFKPKDGPEYINLRDDEFRKAFFDLPVIERAARLGMTNNDAAKSRMFEKRMPEKYEEMLKDWSERRSKEIRYLNSGNKKQYEAYQQLKEEREKQLEILAGLERRAQANKEKQNDERITDRHGRADAGDRPGRAAPGNERGLGRTGRAQPDIAPIGTEPPPAARGSLRNMPARTLASEPRRSQGILPSDVHHELVQPGSNKLREGLRRADAQVSQVTGRTSDSVAGQIQRDNREAAAARAADAKPTIQTIKLRLDANRLLADLSATHRLKPSDYLVSEAKDGSARISHKDTPQKHFNVSDFLTKHMHMGWGEAQPYLVGAYDRQRENVPEPTVAAPARPDLYAAFLAEYKAKGTAASIKREIKDLTASHRAENADALAEFKKAKAEVRADESLKWTEQKSKISVLAASKARADGKRAERHEGEVAAIERLADIKEQYRLWLQRKAQAGNQEMLTELRAQRIEPHRKASVLDRIIGAPSKQQPDTGKLLDQADQGRKPEWQYTVARNGDVTYYMKNREMIVDAGRKVYMLETSDQTLEQGLRLAAIKWGGKMQLTGSEAFIRQAVAVAARKNLRIEFSDPDQNAALQAEKERIRKDKEFTEAARRRAEIEEAKAQRAEAKRAAEAAAKAPAQGKPEQAEQTPEKPATPAPAAPEQPEQAPGQQVHHQVVYAPEQDDDLEQEQVIKPPGT